jgi:hypothetical protein
MDFSGIHISPFLKKIENRMLILVPFIKYLISEFICIQFYVIGSGNWIKIFLNGGLVLFFVFFFRLHGVLDKLRSVTTGKIYKTEGILEFLLDIACDSLLFKVIFTPL